MPKLKLKEKTTNSPTFLILNKIKKLPNTVEIPAIKDNNNGNKSFIINSMQIIKL